MINVTKTYLPPLEEFQVYLEEIWASGKITNRGDLVLELEKQLKDYLQVPNLLFVTNGMLALQLAIKALGLKGEIITTPFSYVATTTAILWEHCEPIFVDINKQTFCIDADLIEEKITEKTTAILATHVYGYPCEIEKIQEIAEKHNLKVIYDAAHAFGIQYKGQSILNYGDISAISFHATKLFHTIEGGAVVCQDAELLEKMRLLHQFGHIGDEHFEAGTNAKTNEMQAAMGLCNLPKIAQIVENRKNISEMYKDLLKNIPLQYPHSKSGFEYNYAYFPVVFETEELLLKVKNKLDENQIYTRRYFYPSLNTLPYLKNYQVCPASEDIAKRVLCLPLYDSLAIETIEQICNLIQL
jgi:dTDP-4-amino-4,6-dideoxygalactose transaminase